MLFRSERRPLALRNTAFARGFADSIGLFAPDPGLESAGPDGAALRAKAGEYLERHARAEFNIPGITFGSRYDGSPIISHDRQAAPPDRADAYEPSGVPGGRAPHMWLPDGRSLFDLFGFEFTLLDLGDKPNLTGLQSAFGKLAGLVRALAPDQPGLRALYGARFVLVRPDQMIAWRGERLPDRPAQLLVRAAQIQPGFG